MLPQSGTAIAEIYIRGFNAYILHIRPSVRNSVASGKLCMHTSLCDTLFFFDFLSLSMLPFRLHSRTLYQLWCNVLTSVSITFAPPPPPFNGGTFAKMSDDWTFSP